MLPINQARMARHTRGIRPVIEIMNTMGFNSADIIKGTGIDMVALDDQNYIITLEAEYSFYRNILRLTDNPAIGLDIGYALRPETYGIYGYALLTASTVREYAKISEEFGVLSLTHFSPSLRENGKYVEYRFTPTYPIPRDLVQVFSDRDLGASVSTTRRVGIEENILTEVHLMHSGEPSSKHYRDFFGCSVKFDQPHNATFCRSSVLDQPLKAPDPELLDACLAKCRKLVNQVNISGSVKARVTELLISSRGRFLSIEEIAAKMKCSSRTLRRNLRSEGSSYAEALKDVRFELAKEYLGSGLKIEAVSEMLGYSEVAAFSRAFKQWSGLSPKSFREAMHADPESLPNN